MRWFIVFCIVAAPAAIAQTAPPDLPSDAAYVTVGPDGHLQLDGQRVRFWGVIGGFPAGRGRGGDVDPHKANEALVERLHALGFNMVRFWAGYGQGEEAYTKGDGSRADLIDHFIHLCAQRGMKIWLAGFGGSVGTAKPDDAGIVDDPATAAAWREAVSTFGERGMALGKGSLANMWDPRLKALRLQRLQRTADHVNQWTGYRYGDDPAIAVWELVNEDWWFVQMMRGRHLRLPDHFLGSLYAGFNAFLRARYADDAALRAAWAGNLLEGESLERGTVAMLPIEGRLDGDAQARSLGVNVGEVVAPAVTRDLFSDRRQADVVAYLLTIWIETKQAESAAAKQWGKSLRLAPMVWDTGVGWSLQTQFMHQHADAVVHATYINGTHHPDPSHRRFPWYSALEELPKLAWDKPWLEHNRAPGKPFFVYENNIMQPAKYRGEHPMRMAHLGSLQDWDIVCFHYWGFARDPALPDPYDRAMDYTLGGHPQGYHFQFDAVLQSAITLAGEVFKRRHLDPAPQPTTFIFGRRSLHSMDQAGYGDAAERFLATTYRWGMRLLIDPTREDDEIVGPSRRRAIYEPSPIAATPQMVYDHQRGHLRFDAPGAAMFCGFFAQAGGPVRFDSGLVLRDVRVLNDAGMPYPVTEDEKYVTFGVVSRDGRPLAETRDAILSAMSTSFNSGFTLDASKIAQEWFLSGETFPAKAGGMPVLFARVEATLDAGPLRGMRYRMLDWHRREIASGTIDGETFVVPADKPVWMIELTR